MTTYLSGTVQVSVPATSANLGPGFDSLGLALGLRDTVTVETIASGLEVCVRGAGQGAVPLTARHLVHRAMVRAFAAMDCATPPLRLLCDNQIPHSRGLGSSSAAIISGLCAARGLVAGGSLLLDDDALFALAVEMEGHPDNVAPALFGGFTVAYEHEHRHRRVKLAVDPRIHVVVFVPPDPVQTRVARGLLPLTVPHVDAAVSSGRAALLVAALTGRPELLLAATEDRLHQDYREPAMPETLRFMRALRARGVPAVVSGAGPSVLAFVSAADEAQVQALCPAGWRALPLPVEPVGAVVRLPS